MPNHRFLYTENKLVFKGFETYIYNMLNFTVLKHPLFGLAHSTNVFFKAINVMLTKSGKAAGNGSVLGVSHKGKGVRAAPAVRGNSSLGCEKKCGKDQ